MKTTNLTVAALIAVALIGCGGGGGGSSPAPVQTTPPVQTPPVQTTPAPAPTPIAVAATSYENKTSSYAAVGAATLPTFTDHQYIGTAYAYADFQQNGAYTLVATTSNTTPGTTDKDGISMQPGKIYFYQRVNGQWVDKTPLLLADTTGCVSARKAIVADFNGDHKPDVFFACHGYDAPPYAGEQQRMLLSQADGKYKNVVVPVTAFGHGAAAADTTGQGYADILLTDTSNDKIPLYLVNNRDGTFTVDKTRFPASLFQKQIYTAELIDVNGDGKVDAFLAGSDLQDPQYQMAPTFFMNDGTNNFKGQTTTLPLIASSVGSTLGVTLDVVVTNNTAYLLRSFTINGVPNYSTMIQKTDLTTKTSTEIYAHSGAYVGTQQTWFPWISAANGSVFSTDAVFNVKVPQ